MLSLCTTHTPAVWGLQRQADADSELQIGGHTLETLVRPAVKGL